MRQYSSGSSGGGDPEKTRERAMNDPEVQQIMGVNSISYNTMLGLGSQVSWILFFWMPYALNVFFVFYLRNNKLKTTAYCILLFIV